MRSSEYGAGCCRPTLSCILGAALLCLPQTQAQGQTQAQTTSKIVLIIDDLGYRRTLGQRAIRLQGALNYSVLPHTPHGRELAQLAAKAGKEVLLHVPMQALSGKEMGPGGLSTNMSYLKFSATLTAAAMDIPATRGLSNHMGSALTTHSRSMTWLLSWLKAKGMYYVDSLTNGASLGPRLAAAYDVPHLTRDVFLDHVEQASFVRRQFARLLATAARRGFAVGVAHPKAVTLSVLEQELPRLSLRGFELAFVSDILGQLPSSSPLPASPGPSSQVILPQLRTRLALADQPGPEGNNGENSGDRSNTGNTGNTGNTRNTGDTRTIGSTHRKSAPTPLTTTAPRATFKEAPKVAPSAQPRPRAHSPRLGYTATVGVVR